MARKRKRVSPPSKNPRRAIVSLPPIQVMADGRILNPFTIAVDQNEVSHKKDYTFEGLRSNADQGNRIIYVPTNPRTLDEADYEVEGFPGFAVERKQKADLFQSIGKRQNFLERMKYLSDHYRTSAIVVEATIDEIREKPPEFFDPVTQQMIIVPYPSSLLVLRTVQSWSLRFPTVQWWFLRNRRAAEGWTFRLLEHHWRHSHEASR